MFLMTLLFACGPGPATIEGVVYESYAPDAPPLAGATVRLLDADDESPIGKTTTDAEGRFSLDAELGIHVYAEIDGDGLRPARFPGVIDLPTVRVEDRSLFGFSEAEAAELEEIFAGCPSAGGAGLAVGEVRAYEIATVVEGEHPTINNAQVLARSNDGTEWDACYFDDDGEDYAPSAIFTGGTGWFVLPGLPAGTHDLEITYEFGAGQVETQVYPLNVAEGGTVSPWFPAWMGQP